MRLSRRNRVNRSDPCLDWPKSLDLDIWTVPLSNPRKQLSMYISYRSGCCTLPHCLLAMRPEQTFKFIVDDVSVRVKTFSRVPKKKQSRNTWLFKVKTLNLYIRLSITNELRKYPDTFLNLKLKTIHLNVFSAPIKGRAQCDASLHSNFHEHMRSHDAWKRVTYIGKAILHKLQIYYEYMSWCTRWPSTDSVNYI